MMELAILTFSVSDPDSIRSVDPDPDSESEFGIEKSRNFMF